MGTFFEVQNEVNSFFRSGNIFLTLLHQQEIGLEGQTNILRWLKGLEKQGQAPMLPICELN